MNKLNDTGSANLKVLDESELGQVVGGRGGRGRWNGGGHMSSGRHGGNGGGRFGGGGGGGNTFNITIVINNF